MKFHICFKYEYYEKFSIGKCRTELMPKKILKICFFQTICLIFKSFDKFFIVVDNNVSITRLEFTLKTLYVRMEYKNSEDSQMMNL